ncbi:hypothetical protein EJ05DRAFT_507244 [Pseudovirgaria hyperparasitica]|uniref:Zn(2)-C6 fungal-type domain-containing protein n=1 Tax=Pseudovirgaria hyperparasitica TaxID=470096 RepID=A0A6A6WJN7_9PEZI|nr:uncharacterized protein EJ05DRAFT_507244 [Pseudovirgaria hyperparasitica]KAF2761591.1 hypothetical protein EJ05DRAFT_507244 [Pseudovirgaria hyperparasitica]
MSTRKLHPEDGWIRSQTLSTVKINSSAPLANILDSGPLPPTVSSNVEQSARNVGGYHSLHHGVSPTQDASSALQSSRPATLPGSRFGASNASRAEEPRMRGLRSSIACARCRRSKVKCVNNGVNTTCRACETSGRQCTYPPPATGGVAARREAALGVASADSLAPGDGSRRPPRSRKAGNNLSDGYPAKESSKPFLDALDPSIITPQTWTELFDIFQLHYSTDLPFLHPPTFQKPLRKSALHSPITNNPEKAPPLTPPASSLLLLAFLALTSRFHSTLIVHHSSSKNPLVAAEYYASAAKDKLSGIYGEDMGKPDLERIQALLMLGLHEWSMCRGAKAWIMIGGAVRTAQILGLQFEQELDDQPLSSSVALNVEAHHIGIHRDRGGMTSRGETFTEQEVRRRTFWSCFIMDRYLSSGKYRPQMLDVKDLRIQLPSSDRAFLFGEKVRTALLGDELNQGSSRSEVQNNRQASLQRVDRGRQSFDSRSSDTEKGRWEVNQDEGVLSRFIRILDLHGKVVKWSCAGGRRQEQHPPWDPRCTCFELRKLLTNFKNSLPRDLTLSPANISAHITSRTSTPFTLMHTLCTLSSVILHREYVPFIPIRSAKPQGPLDPPTFPPEEYQTPPGFWEESAREIFKSAREFVDLIRMCQEWEVLVETPIIGFAAYTAAFCGVYAINFPWMDPEGYMCSRKTQAMPGNTGKEGLEAARKALEVVGQLRMRLKMADGWFRTIKRCHHYFVRMKRDFKKNSQASETGSANSTESYRQLSLREGREGGGLEEYKLIENLMKEFGSTDGEELELMDVDSDQRNIFEGTSESSGAKSETDGNDGAIQSASIRQDRWNAINNSQSLVSNSYSQAYQAEQGNHPQARGSMMPMASNRPPYDATTSYERGPYTAITQSYADAGHRSSAPSNDVQGQSGPWPPPGLRETWLNNLDTKFGGDDVAAFVAGNTWQEFSGMGGWLGNVFSSAPPTTTSNM